ncbi:MAG: DUF2142 domain-containing protein [Candidatus Dormibacteraeota bacterium]|uniref:DUF2142 domain-containing protein n=1 Tax=Candidatus Amunia macphersoniae TaxID=3127014 RepID=A0A934KJ64_9BACT|nr:DUF2142 domain-containing protein [Candidatus Dormibacteraeota bacterium]
MLSRVRLRRTTPAKAGDARRRFLGGRNQAVTGRHVISVWCASLLLLGVAWVVINPAPSGSDEPAHYIHALATGGGEIVGPHALFPSRDANFPDAVNLWDQSSRRFSVPARIAPASTFACTAGNWSVPATCTNGSRCERWAAACATEPPTTGSVSLVTYTGDYEPTFYVLPGVVARLANNDVNGLRAARLGGLLVAVALLGMAGLLLWDRREPAMSLVGLLISVTPTVMYMNSVVNPNGGEIVSSIAFIAALLRIRRDGEATSRFTWMAAGVSGALCGFSKIDGPAWVLVATVAIVALLGIKGSFAIVRHGGRWAAFAVTAAAVGVLADQVWWHFIVGVPTFLHPASSGIRYITEIAGAVPQLVQQMIGAFGWGEGDISAGSFTYLVWSVMAVGVASLAMLVASRRERVVISALVAFDIVYMVVTGAVARVEFGFGGTGTLGRYLLPLVVITTLTAGEVLTQNHRRLGSLSPRRLVAGIAITTAACQFVSLWMAARAYAVSTTGPLLFLGKSQWYPPLGWAPWLALAAIGCSGVAVVGWLAMISNRRTTLASSG